MPTSISSFRDSGGGGGGGRFFGLNTPAGQTAAPGNAVVNPLAGCSFTLPAGTGRLGGQLRIWVAGRKGNNNNTDVIALRLRCGAAGTTADPFLSSFGLVGSGRIDLNADTRSFAFATRWRFESATLIRRMGAVNGMASESAQIGTAVSAGTTDTIPNINTADLKFHLCGGLSVGTAEWIVVDDIFAEIIDPFSV